MGEEAWRVKLPQTVVDKVDRFRNKRDGRPVLERRLIASRPCITLEVPADAMYKKIKITMTVEE